MVKGAQKVERNCFEKISIINSYISIKTLGDWKEYGVDSHKMNKYVITLENKNKTKMS